MYLNTKYELYNLRVEVTGKCKVFKLTFRQTDKCTDRQSTLRQYAPDLSVKGHKNMDLYKLRALTGKNLTLCKFMQTSPFYMLLLYKSFENTVGKGEIARNEQFLLFLQCFLPSWKTFSHFHQLKLSSVHSFSLEESKICRLGED